MPAWIGNMFRNSIHQLCLTRSDTPEVGAIEHHILHLTDVAFILATAGGL